MAQKRMFDKTITNSDIFLELPDSSQVLYFHLSMNADDDGFINNWKSIIRMTGTKEDDLKILISKQFIIPFESGVIVIRHWRLNNYLRNDRHKETAFKKELALLNVNENEEYILKNGLGIPGGIPVVDTDKNRIDKNRIEYNNIVVQIIDYLNLKTGKHYKSSSANTIKHIKARLNEGYSLEDFKKVIDIKTLEWLNNKEMNQYLRPDTLFGTKFESYLNQQERKPTLKDIASKIDYKDFLEKGVRK